MEEALETIRAAYRAGRLGYAELAEAERAALEARLMLASAAADVWRSRAALERLAGPPEDSIREGGAR